MLIAVTAAGGVFARPEHRCEVVALLLALHNWPMASGLAVVAVWYANRVGGAQSSAEAVFLQAVALELRAGATVRSALDSASLRTPGLPLDGATRLARAGAPMADVAGFLAAALPRYGAMTAAAIDTAGMTGGRVASVFDALAQIAVEDLELARERRAVTAQARISALIVGGLPVLFLGFGVVSGRLGALLETGIGVWIVGVGLTLVVVGCGSVAFMLRRALA